MKALVITGKEKVEVKDIAEPKVRADYVKVKTVAVALNPTDWKHIYYMADEGAIVGCDFAGIVEEVGESVKSGVKKGDRIAGVTHGANRSDHEHGCFAEHAIVKDGMFIEVPKSMSMEEASTLGIGISTVGQAMYQSLQLPLPSEPAKEPFPILIYGGSSATGTLAIQFAKLSNLTVVTTCSPHNFDLVKSLGADAAFDYNDPSCAEQIREYTKDNLHYVFDTISLEPTAAICHSAMSSKSEPKNVYTSLLPVKKFPRDDVENKHTMAYTILGETYEKMGRKTEAKPDHYEFGKMFWAQASDLFAKGKLTVHPPEIRKGGLEKIWDGLEDLRNNKVSGVKLVYPLA